MMIVSELFLHGLLQVICSAHLAFVYDKSEMLANKIVIKIFLIYWDKMPLQGAIGIIAIYILDYQDWKLAMMLHHRLYTDYSHRQCDHTFARY